VQAGAETLAREALTGLLTGTSLGSVSTGVGYSGFGERSADTAALGGSPLYANTYLRDKLGRLTQKTETIQGTTTVFGYAYDPAGRLEQLAKDGIVSASYAYDANGNRLSATTTGGTTSGSYDAQDRLLAYGTRSYDYTGNGDLASKTDTATGQITSFGYDTLGNLVSALLPDGRFLAYVIDGQSRRVGKRVNGALVQGWLYQDALEPVAELDGAGNVVARFVYGSSAHVPDYMVRGGVTYRVLSDHLGSVRLVVNASTGAVAQRIDYDEFGNITTDTNPGFQPFGFAGGLYDADTGLVRFGARDYDAQVGRWTAKDPIRFDAGESNLYGYVVGDPVNATDPNGLVVPFLGHALARLGAMAFRTGQTSQEIFLAGNIGDAAIGGLAALVGFNLPPSLQCQGVGAVLDAFTLIGGIDTLGLGESVAFANAGGLGATLSSAGLGTSLGVGGLAFLGGVGIGTFVNNQVLDQLPGGNPVLNVFLRLGGLE
jgi:RHS repeat-associated protein